MTKRVSLARALALDPEIVFLDEPTSGLDPISAGDFDDLIGTLQKTLGLTVFMVTHDLDSLFAICDRVAVLGHQKVIAAGPISDLLLSDDPWLKAYFHGKRGVIRLAGAADRPAALAADGPAAEREALSTMETRANYVLIGAFTLAAVVGAFLFVMWIAGYGTTGSHRKYQVVFNGSVSGLSNGANVLFNGIKIGEVTHLTFSRSDPHQVVADIDVNSDAPIDNNTKARLETQGLTGAGVGRSPRRPRASGRRWLARTASRRSSTPNSRCSCRIFWTASAPSRSGPPRFWTTPTRSSPTIPSRSIRRSRTSISSRRPWPIMRPGSTRR